MPREQRSVAETLFPYQIEGARWLATKRFALLADEMGLGKSAQAIVAADAIGAQRILILCPANIRVQWIREFEKFSTLKRSCAAFLSGMTSYSTQADVLTCSYDLTLNSSVNGLLHAFQPDLLILDEAHFLKSIDAKRTHAVLARGGLIHRARHTWALTGTPTPNHAGEIYPLAKCFGATGLDYASFVGRYCKVRATPYGPKITGSQNVHELRAILAPITLRRKKEDVMTELPEIMFSDLVVEPGPVDEEIVWPEHYIMNRVDELHAQIEAERTLIGTNLKTTGLGQAGLTVLDGLKDKVSSLRQYVGLQKLHPLTEIITDELENNAYEKLVIFCVHRHLIEGFRQSLSKFKPVTLYGGTPANKRSRHIDTFINNPRCRVFIGNIVAAGVGVDGLQRVCHQVIMAECDWTPGNNAQAVMRVHRIGQTKPVSVRIASVADSVDEQIQKALKRKLRDITAIWD